MIPAPLMALIKAQPEYAPRTKVAQATRALTALGIALDSEFAQVYLACYPADFKSPSSDEVLMDIADPCEEILMGTEFIHEVWELPKNFIAFTSLQGEGGYLLDKDCGGVWDFGLEDREDFVAGRLAPHWNSFSDFLAWFLGPCEP